MTAIAKDFSRFTWTRPHLRSEGYSQPRECDSCGAVFGFLPEIETCSQSIYVTHGIKVLGDSCFPRIRNAIVVCCRCLPNYVEPLEASGYDLTDIAINGIPYLIHNARELAVLKEIAGWGCFHSGSWVFTAFDPPKAQAFVHINSMATVEMTNFPNPRFRLKLEVKEERKVFFSKLNIGREMSYEELIALVKEVEVAIQRKHNLVG